MKWTTEAALEICLVERMRLFGDGIRVECCWPISMRRILIEVAVCPALQPLVLSRSHCQIVHAEIVSSGAFSTHAGVVARAAERIVLVERGVDPPSVTVPEAGHAAVPDGYHSALEAYATATDAGLAQWLRYASQAFARGAEASPLVR